MDEQRIRTRRDFLRGLQRALTLLLTDIDVIGTHQYLYAVDFYAIHAYMYKATAPGIFPTIPDEPHEKSFARAQLALDFVFSGRLRPILLIPPYAIELRNHLDVLKMQVDTSISDIGAASRDRVRHMVASSKEFADFVELRSSVASRAEDDLRAAALEIGKKYFPELYSVLGVFSARGAMSAMKILRSLFLANILEDAEKAIPEFETFGRSSTDSSIDKWYEKISAKRHGRRAFQSRVDAMACEYIISANQELNKRRKVLILISPSYHLETTLEEAIPCINVGGCAAFGPVRNLTYILLSLTHKGDRQNVCFSLNTVNKLLEIYSQLPNGPLEREWPLIEQAEANWKESENLLLMTESLLPAPLREPEAIQDLEFLNILLKLHEAVQTNQRQLEEEIRENLAGLRAAIHEMDEAIPRCTDLPRTLLRLTRDQR